MSTATRIGVLGGTFDPIHVGHLDVAASASAALDLSDVMFIPSRVPPHRAAPPTVSEYHRFAMVALAVADCDRYKASDLELRTDGPSYTSATLELLARQGMHPSQLFFLTGADAFAEIATWYDYPEVLNRSHFVVVSRSGHSALEIRSHLPDIAPRMRDACKETDQDGPDVGTSIWLIDATTTSVSSSDIRRRLASGESVTGLVPPSVATYIERHQLYHDLTEGRLHD